MAKEPKDLWPEERKALKAIQLAFDISNDAQKQIKREAIEKNRTPSDQLRAILGLPVKKPQRPRLTLSLNTDELRLLAQRYGIDASDTLAIKERAANELIDWSQRQQQKGTSA